MASLHGPMTDQRKERIWLLWQQGRPMSEIARDISKPPATVYSYLLYHGGIKPKIRVRRSSALSLEEREAISRGLASGGGIRTIARYLGRSPSTISREVSRNGGIDKYRAHTAEEEFLKKVQSTKATIAGCKFEAKIDCNKVTSSQLVARANSWVAKNLVSGW